MSIVESAPVISKGFRVQRWLKALIDLCGSVACLLLLSPLLLLVSVLVKLDSSGPLIHRRHVIGLHGRGFDALKFRTMIVDADTYLQRHPELMAEYQKNIKLRDDPRVTRVGRLLRRLSLDELPQLLNVLRGEMSLVGPRMVTRDELSKYGDFAVQRMTVRPGLTGLWQVSGRQDVSYETRIMFDKQYIDSWSLWLDFKILLKTVPAVLTAKGAY